MINTVIQIILSVFLIAIMAFICYSIYNNEIITSIKINTTTKRKTEIFTGIFDYTEQKNIMIETYDATADKFLDINPSTNQNGGAEYSYNFWLFFDLNSENSDRIAETHTDITGDFKNYAYIVLFYKGEVNKLPLLTNNYQCDFYNNVKLQSLRYLDENINIKNPLVKIRNDAQEIIVEYNNINFPESYNSSATKFNCENTNDTKKRNLNKFGIKEIDTKKLRQTFNMITIVFQEKPKNELIFNVESANCRVYFNGILIENRIAHSSSIENNDDFTSIKSRVMKSNLSKLLINPSSVTPAIKNINTIKTKRDNDQTNIEISPLQLADLSYFNYALSQKEITLLYNKGYTKSKVSFKSKVENSIPKGTLYKIDKEEYLKPI